MALIIKNLLIEQGLKLLKEIGEGNAKQFSWQKQFYELNGQDYYTTFYAPLLYDPIQSIKNIPFVEIIFEFDEINKYNVAYTINDDEKQAFKASMNYYLKIMATMVAIIKEFIKIYNPKVLKIESRDKDNILVPGQKDRIYFAYIEKIVPTLKDPKNPNMYYETARVNDGFSITRQDKPKQF